MIIIEDCIILNEEKQHESKWQLPELINLSYERLASTRTHENISQEIDRAQIKTIKVIIQIRIDSPAIESPHKINKSQPNRTSTLI